jgi:NADPH-dependent 2,4-dienoyl-CoA reductase/sulfur reductase-like enzyme
MPAFIPPDRSAAHDPTLDTSTSHVAIIGGGPAGLMAAEVLSQAGIKVDLYDGMPSVGASSCWPVSVA